jgi:hypothetical protein
MSLGPVHQIIAMTQIKKLGISVHLETISGVRTLRKYVEEEKTALPMEMLRHQRLGIEKMLGKYGVELLPTVNHANTSISVMQ